jgi:hypothetical protein
MSPETQAGWPETDAAGPIDEGAERKAALASDQ